MNFDLYSYQEKFRWIEKKISLVKEIVPIQYLDSVYVRTFLYGGSRSETVFMEIFFSWMFNTKINDQRDGKVGKFDGLPYEDSLASLVPNALIRNHKVFNFIIKSQQNTMCGTRYIKHDEYYLVVNTLASIIVRSKRAQIILSDSFGEDLLQIESFNQFVDEVLENKHLDALKKCAHIVLENTSDQLVGKKPLFFRGMSIVANGLSDTVWVCRLILDTFDGVADDFMDELIEASNYVFQQEFMDRVVGGNDFPDCPEFEDFNRSMAECRADELDNYKTLHPELEEIEDIENLSDLPKDADLEWEALMESNDEGFLPEIVTFEMKSEPAFRLMRKLGPKLPDDYELLYARGILVVAKYTMGYGASGIDSWASDVGILDFINNFR